MFLDKTFRLNTRHSKKAAAIFNAWPYLKARHNPWRYQSILMKNIIMGRKNSLKNVLCNSFEITVPRVKIYSKLTFNLVCFCQFKVIASCRRPSSKLTSQQKPSMFNTKKTQHILLLAPIYLEGSRGSAFAT